MEETADSTFTDIEIKKIQSAKKARQPQWFVMRDLKRSNTKQPAYKILGDMNIKVFTPMVWKLSVQQGKKIRRQVPFMQDLLFVRESRHILDPIVERFSTFQYRYLKGGYQIPMTVKDCDMERFIKAVEATDNPCFYTPDEITEQMIGRKVRIIGGPMNGYEGHLQKLKGSRIKRLFVELPNFLSVAIEVNPEFIQIIKE